MATQLIYKVTEQSVAIGIPLRPTTLYAGAKQHRPWYVTWMGYHSGMSISADSPSDETLNRGPLALLLRRQYQFSFRINIMQFSIFNFQHIMSI